MKQNSSFLIGLRAVDIELTDVQWTHDQLQEIKTQNTSRKATLHSPTRVIKTGGTQKYQ